MPSLEECIPLESGQSTAVLHTSPNERPSVIPQTPFALLGTSPFEKEHVQSPRTHRQLFEIPHVQHAANTCHPKRASKAQLEASFVVEITVPSLHKKIRYIIHNLSAPRQNGSRKVRLVSVPRTATVTAQSDEDCVLVQVFLDDLH